jgi:hypothetical protein
MSFHELLAVLHELHVEIALPVNCNPVEWHAISAAFGVEVVAFDKDSVHALVLIVGIRILMVVGAMI